MLLQGLRCRNLFGTFSELPPPKRRGKGRATSHTAISRSRLGASSFHEFHLFERREWRRLATSLATARHWRLRSIGLLRLGDRRGSCGGRQGLRRRIRLCIRQGRGCWSGSLEVSLALPI